MFQNRPKVFVITPLNDTHRQVIDTLRCHLGESYEIFTSEDMSGCRNIVHDIMQGILSADAIIADLTGTNFNVAYELAIAHSLNKKVIMVTQDGRSNLPFDIRQYRVIRYSLSPDGIQKYAQDIEMELRNALSSIVPFSNPISDYLAVAPTELTDLPIPPLLFQLPQSTSTIEIDEEGILDYIADMEDDSARIQQLANELTDAAKKMCNDANKRAKEIERANAVGGSGTASFVRKQAKAIARSIKELSDNINSKSDKIQEAWSRVENNFQKLLNHPLVLNNIDRVEIGQTILRELSLLNKQNLTPQLQELRTQLQQLIGFQKDLTRAARALDTSLMGLLRTYNNMLGSIDGIEERAKQILEST